MFILCLFGFGWLFGFCVYKFPLFVYLFILLLFFCSCFYLLEGEPKPSVMFYSFFFSLQIFFARWLVRYLVSWKFRAQCLYERHFQSLSQHDFL